MHKKVQNIKRNNKEKIIEKAKENSGITLIALIITIIVLLILAGVAINAITGNQGMVEKAAWAKFVTEYRKVEEAERLKEYDMKLKKYFKGSKNEQIQIDKNKIENITVYNKIASTQINDQVEIENKYVITNQKIEPTEELKKYILRTRRR